ncbi:MAG: ABC transporter permease [Pseudomonadota bacterium]
MDLVIIVSVINATIQAAVPLIFAALAGLYSERAGVFDIGLEGKMLGAAFAAAAVAFYMDSAWLGLMAGILSSVLLSLVHGFASITVRGNQIVSGVAINFFAAGVTVLFGQALFRQGGRTPMLSSDGRFLDITLPLADTLQNVPLVGTIYSDIISGHNILVYFAILAVPLTAWILYRTRIGLRLRAVGENPGAVDTAGISVTFERYRAVIICGVLCGFAGTSLSLAQSVGFGKDMTAGRGYIALAALIFAKWRPWPVLGACLLFAFFDATSTVIQGVDGIPVIGSFNPQFIQALPYILVVVLLAGFIGKAIPPKAGGVPYTKER